MHQRIDTNGVESNRSNLEEQIQNTIYFARINFIRIIVLMCVPRVCANCETPKEVGYLVRCRYNAVNFLQNIHERHPIARPAGRGMGCFLCQGFSFWLIFSPIFCNDVYNTMLYWIFHYPTTFYFFPSRKYPNFLWHFKNLLTEVVRQLFATQLTLPLLGWRFVHLTSFKGLQAQFP